MAKVPAGKDLLDKATQNAMSVLEGVDLYEVDKEGNTFISPQMLSACVKAYLDLTKAHGEEPDEMTPEQVKAAMRDKGLEIIEIKELERLKQIEADHNAAS